MVMPIYEYKCTKCGKQFEVMRRMADANLSQCSVCGGKLKKLITNTSFVLKGGGWYVTDYPSKDRKTAMDAKKTRDKKVDAQFKEKTKSSPGAKTEPATKTEKKTEAK